MKRRITKSGLSILIAMLIFINCIQLSTIAGAVDSLGSEPAQADTTIATPQKELKLWYDAPAPTSGSGAGWEQWSLPIGCGYMGVNLFGRTTTERMTLTENSLVNPHPGTDSGVSTMSDIFIDFNHTNPTNYTRDLIINDATSHVQYDANGVTYNREAFSSYPDKVTVMKFTASGTGNLTFTLRPTIPRIRTQAPTKTGTVTATGDTITLDGLMGTYGTAFEGQFKVIPTGGTMTATNTAANGTDGGQITVTNADSAIILIAVGTNYELESSVFTTEKASDKLAGNPHPHEKVTKIMADASAKTYDELLSRHKVDYKEYFDRVNFDIGGKIPTIPTNQLLQNYKNGISDPYLEELFFQYGRYLLIASSRQNNLPATLMGIWSYPENGKSSWSGYWHNVNIQMTYWPAFTTNLAELFEPYMDYNEAFRPLAEKNASQYVKDKNPSAYNPEEGENGWGIGTVCWPYMLQKPVDPASTHTGPGSTPYTSQLFWDYYDFTRNEQALKDRVYPALEGAAKFTSKVVKPFGDYLLASPSASSEQTNATTVGTSFDQSTIWENHNNTLKAAKILGIDETDPLITTLSEQMDKLDPINVGLSGQVKEYREEGYYGEFYEYSHRHISQLVGLQPGTLINSTTPAWMDAAKVTLNERGDSSSAGWYTGWGYAQRLIMRARTFEGNKAYDVFQKQLKNRTLWNLWDTHDPYQLEGNLGATAGISEMLLQSHEDFIRLLPSLPDAWADGSYRGLTARGNFEVSVDWTNKQANNVEILSKSGGECTVDYYDISGATVTNSAGQTVPFTVDQNDRIHFNTVEGETYTINNIPAHKLMDKPTGFDVNFTTSDAVLNWNKTPGAVSYNIYQAVDHQSDYTLIKSGVTATNYHYAPGVTQDQQIMFRITAIGKDGRESDGTLSLFTPTKKPTKAEGYAVGDNLHINIAEVPNAEHYNIYKKVGDNYEFVCKSYQALAVIKNGKLTDEYAVTAVSLRESDKQPVQLADKIVQENILKGKSATSNRNSYNANYGLNKMLDGDLGTRMAMVDAAGPFYVQINLDGSFPLNDLKIYEFRAVEDPEGSTRSGQTTIEVYDGANWTTIIDKKTLGPAGTGATTFDLGGVTGTQIKITFNNVGPRPGYSATIFEATCSSEVSVMNTDKAPLFQSLLKLGDLSLNQYVQSDAVAAIRQTERAAATLLKNMSATQDELNKMVETAEKAITDFKTSNVKQNICLNKTLETSVPASGKTTTRELMVDGKDNTQFKATDVERDLEVVVDLKGTFTIDDFTVVEAMNGTSSRGGQTTIQVLSNNEWKTVVDKQPLTNNVAGKGTTTFDLGGIEGTKVRLYFYNTANTSRICLYELQSTGTRIEQTVTDITSAAISLTQPVAGALPENATVGSEDNYTVASTTWTKGTETHTGAFETNTAYGVQVILSAKDGYKFANDATATGYTVAVSEDGAAMTLTKIFPPTQAATDTNKTILKMVIGYADKAIADGRVDALVPSAYNIFMAAHKNATDVYADLYTDQATVDSAWGQLMNAIHMLSFVAGDKTDLANLIAVCEAYDPDDFVDTTAFDAALKAAQAVNNDPDAMDAEIKTVYDNLNAAVTALVKKQKDELVSSIKYADEKINARIDLFQDGVAKDNFVAAFAKAKEVLDNKKSTQEEIDAATTALYATILEMRYKADKATLEAVLGEAAKVDESLYTPESVAEFQAAIQAAQTVLVNEDATAEDIINAIEGIERTKARLVLLETPVDPEKPTDPSVPTDPSEPTESTPSTDGTVETGKDITADGGTGTTSTNSATTGDSFPIAPLAMVLGLSVLTVFGVRKRNHKS